MTRLIPIGAASLVLGVLCGLGVSRPTLAGNCDAPDDCQFDCTLSDDEWGITDPDGSEEEGVWVVINAYPTNSSNPPSQILQWKDTSVSASSWPPLLVEVEWESPGVGGTYYEQKAITYQGTCNDGSTQYPNSGTASGAPHIRCHDFIVASNPSTLCDSFVGVWRRNVDNGDEHCVLSAEYGIDMPSEITWQGSTYCWSQITVTPYNPYTGGGTLRAVEDCSYLDPWDYFNSGGLTYDCDGADYWRGGHASGNQIDLYYLYTDGG